MVVMNKTAVQTQQITNSVLTTAAAAMAPTVTAPCGDMAQQVEATVKLTP